LAAAALEPAGYPTFTAASIEAGLRLLERVRFAAVLTDVFMDGVGGIEGIQLFRARAPGLAMVAMSGGLDARMAKDHALTAALKIGADRVVAKPFRPETLVEAVEAALQAAKARVGAAASV
jgi:DNA-binding NtrC family response regulator